MHPCRSVATLRKKSARPFRPTLDVLEDRLAPAVFKVPTDFRGLGAALKAVAHSPDKTNTIVLAAGTFQTVNVKITVPKGETLNIIGQGTDQTFLGANQLGRVCEVVNGNVRFSKLTIANGLAPVGGGVLIHDGTVSLNQVVVQNNVARGANGADGQPGQDAFGGGVYLAAGTLSLYHATITHNQALGGKGGPGGDGFNGPDGGNGGKGIGGGLFTFNNATVIGQTASFTHNLAQGGNGGKGADGDESRGGDGGNALGGGFFATFGTLTLFAPWVAGNQAQGGKGGDGGLASTAPGTGIGGAGGNGGEAWGGGGYSHDCIVSLIHAPLTPSFSVNRALGGDGGHGRAGQTAPISVQEANWLFVSFNGGRGGDGGAAYGGGLVSGSLIEMYGGGIANCLARGGKGGDGKDGADGVMNVSVTEAGDVGDIGDGGSGGNGGDGGDAAGGGLYVITSSAFLYRTALTNDSAIGGDGGRGGNGGKHRAGRKASPTLSVLGEGPSIYDFGYYPPNPDNSGGQGGDGGDAWGGGCATDASDKLSVVRSTFAADVVRGGAGGTSGTGGAGNTGGTGGNWFNPNVGGNGGQGFWGGEGRPGGAGGDASGGSLFVGEHSLYLYGSSLVGTAVGGKGGVGGPGNKGGDGGAGAPSLNSGGLHGVGGMGGKGGDTFESRGGDAKGGAVYLDEDVTEIAQVGTTFGDSQVSPGKKGPAGSVGGSGAAGPNFAWEKDNFIARSNGYGPDEYHEASGAGKTGDVHASQDGERGEAGLDRAAATSLVDQVPGDAKVLKFSPLPPKIAFGIPIPYPVYGVALDENGHVAGNFGGFIDLKTDGGRTPTEALYHELGGIPAVSASNGVAVFDNLVVVNKVVQDGKVVNTGRGLYGTSSDLTEPGPFFAGAFELVGAQKVTAVYSKKTHTLTVTGTDANDVIDIRQTSDGRITVWATKNQEIVEIRVIESGKTWEDLPATVVRKIKVGGLGGDDTIRLDRGTGPIRAETLLDGGSDNDLIVGAQLGKNQILGGSGDDQIYGGDEHDTLAGSEGNDALCGGDEDSLIGGAGSDRFLVKDVALPDLVVEDYTPGGEDALIHINTGQTTAFGGVTYTGKAWTDDEIRRLDAVFDKLQSFGFLKLLRQQNGSELAFQRFDNGLAFNAGSYLMIGDVGFNESTDEKLRNAVLHEMGHNWGNENFARWDEFKDLSGWTPDDKSSDPNYLQGRFLGNVENWWYLKSNLTDFVSIYHPNPYEDFAECFTAYFTRMFNWPWNVNDPLGDKAPDKMAFIESWVNTLRDF